LFLLLSVIIVNFNVKHFLEQCLCSLQKALETIESEVWVVDNASTDGSTAYLRQRFESVKLIANEKNIGFANANNQGLANCQGKYVLYLNPDTLLPEDCLSKSLAFMEANPNAGALGIRMIDGTGAFLPESKRSFPSPFASLYKLAGLSKLFPRSKVFGRYALGYLDEFANHEVEVLAGAFMLVRTEIVRKLRGFDPDFFMYGEDIDLSYRIQKLGYKNYYFSESTIIHFKGESTRKGSLNYVKMFYNAMSIFVKKHYTGTSARFYVFFLHIAIWLRALAAAGARFIKKIASVIGRKEPAMIKKSRLVIVGSQQEIDEVEALMKKAGTPVQIAGRLPVNREAKDKVGAIGRLTKDHSANTIIFCHGLLGYKSIIDIIQTVPSGTAFRFHSVGSNSIIGSDSKNGLGEVVAI
jgi:GT2 family glycosyltransferase